MFKLIARNRCALCAVDITQMFTRNLRNLSGLVANLEVKKRYSRKTVNKSYLSGKKKTILLRIKQEKIENIKSVLQKYNIDLSNTHTTRKSMSIFRESVWNVEKAIMFLHELQATNITPTLLTNLPKGIYVPVSLFKAHFSIPSHVNIAEQLLSSVTNPNIDCKAMNHLPETMPMKIYFNECTIYYLKNELNVTDAQLKQVLLKSYTPAYINSFRLLDRLVKFLKNDIKISNSKIIQNIWLIGHHPEYAKTIFNRLHNEIGDISFHLISKYPKLLEYDLYDLEVFMSHLKHYEIPPIMLKNRQIFHLGPVEFKNRIDKLLKNPFTLVYKKHPKFLTLLRDYHIIIPRIRYLEEKNFKFATIHSLTTFNNYLEQLVSIKKLNKKNIKCFFESQFECNPEAILKAVKRHSYHSYVPLVQMYETLNYLKENYPKKIIKRHIYAILYNKSALEETRQMLLKDTEYSQFPTDQLLALIVYKIEEKYNFTGEGVLNNEKDIENSNEDVNQEKKIASSN